MLPALLSGLLASTCVVAGAALALRALRAARRHDRRASLVFAVGLVLALAVGAWLRFGVMPHRFVMYVDEPWYLEAATSLVRSGRPVLCEETWEGPQCTPYAKALGWPTLLAPIVRVTGPSDRSATGFAAALGLLAVLLAAAATRYAGGSRPAALLAAASLALEPLHVSWSATAETHAAGTAALLAGACGALARPRDAWSVLLAGSGLGLAIAIRPELAAAAAPWAVACLRGPSQTRRRVAALSAGAVLVAAGLLAAAPMWSLNTRIFGGFFFQPRALPANVAALARELSGFLWLTLGLAVCGVVALRRARRDALWICLGGAVAVALTVLCFLRFQQRMILGATVLLAPLAGLAVDLAVRRDARRAGAGWRASLALVTGAGAAVLGVRGVNVRARDVPLSDILELRLPALAARVVPEGAFVVAEQPPALRATSGLRVMRTSLALEDGGARLLRSSSVAEVFFSCDMYCEPGFEGAVGGQCATFMRTFALAPVAEERQEGLSYGIYRVMGRRTEEQPIPACARRSHHGD